MKRRGSSSRVSAERRAESALPAGRSSAAGVRERASKSACGSRNGGGIDLSCSSESETLHNWLSRTSSAISVRSNGSCLSFENEEEERFGKSVGHRRCKSICTCGSYGRQTRASMLRLNYTPLQSEEPNRGYADTVKRRKEFTRRCKSLSASHVRCKTLPDGEPLHAFITGARYNRAHNMDSHSLERIGVYIARSDASRSFVNLAGTIPPSDEIYGRVKSNQKNTSQKFQKTSSTKKTASESRSTVEGPLDSAHQHHHQTSADVFSAHMSHYHRQNSSMRIRGYHGNQIKDEDGVTNSCGQRPIISMRTLSSDTHSPGRRGVESLAVSHNLGECAISRNEALSSSDRCDVGSSYGSDLQPLSPNHKHVNIGNLNSPQNSSSGPPTTIESTTQQTEGNVEQWSVSTHRVEGDEGQDVATSLQGSVEQPAGSTAVISTSNGEGEVKRHTTVTRGGQQMSAEESGMDDQEGSAVSGLLEGGASVRPQYLPNTLDNGIAPEFNNEYSEDELISPEARALINDEILKECQCSTSSFTSSSASQEIAVHDKDISIVDKDRYIRTKSAPTPTLEPGHSAGQLIQADSSCIPLPSNSGNKGALLRQSSDNLAASDLQDGPSELSAKSSCIFVDMSTLNLDQVQAEDENDQSSND